MARIKQPQLPPGALNDFFVALHELHLKAGYPSTREIQKDIGRQYVSHTTIHKAFVGPRLPGWAIVEQLIEALSERSRQDNAATIANLHSLWQAAARSLQTAYAHPTDAVRSATQDARPNIQSGTVRSLAEILPGALDEVEDAGTRRIDRNIVPTGFADLDNLTGGMRAGSLIVTGAQPSIGKSMFLITVCARNAIDHGFPVAVFSSEMTENETVMRILAAQSRVPHFSMRSGQMTHGDWTRLAEDMAKVVETPLWYMHSASLDMDVMENEAKDLVDKHGLRLLAIDNLNSLETFDQDPEATLCRLKQISIDLHLPILVTACMKYPETPRSYAPRATDLWNAQHVIRAADLLILLNRPDAYDFESPRLGEIDLIVTKNRYGPVATVTAAFQGHYSRIVDFFISSDSAPAWSQGNWKKSEPESKEDQDG